MAATVVAQTTKPNTLVAENVPSDPDPAHEYSELFKAYGAIGGGLRSAKTDLARKAAVERLGTFAAKFVDLAANYPRDPIALTALQQAVQVVASTDSGALQVWEMNASNFATGCTDNSAARTTELILRDHIESDQLGPLIDRMRYGYRLEYESCLSTLLEKNPHREVRGLACLALAQFLNDKRHMLGLVNDRPELSECYAIVFGKDYLASLKRLGDMELTARIERLFEQAAEQYTDLPKYNTTVGETAKLELYEIRHLGIGKTAPDITGRDQHGEQFKLSDYRGRVVMLYFWSEY